MRQIIEDLIQYSWNNNNSAAFEKFQNGGYNLQPQPLPEITKKNIMPMVLSVIIVYLLLLFLGKYLWNNIVVDLFTFAKPIKSIWHLLGLSILVKLIIN